MELDKATQTSDVNMAQDSEAPKSVDKGKGKAVDDAKKDKQLANGKKEDAKVESMTPYFLCAMMIC